MIALRPLSGSPTSGGSGGDSRGGDAHGSLEVGHQSFEYKVGAKAWHIQVGCAPPASLRVHNILVYSYGSFFAVQNVST